LGWNVVARVTWIRQSTRNRALVQENIMAWLIRGRRGGLQRLKVLWR
jgi:hypothetical protein